MQKTMKAAVLRTFGGPPSYEDYDVPIAAPDEHLVTVRAAAIKPVDRLTATGLRHPLTPTALPAVCGLDGMGTLADGTRILFAVSRAPYGGMAEKTVVPRHYCFPIPDDLDDVAAAALFNPGMSAWFAVTWRAQVQPGETVLVLGATGAAGTLATQIAKSAGAGRVIAAGRSEAALAESGAEPLSLVGTSDELADRFFAIAGTGFDVVIDFVWGTPVEALLAAVRRPGYPVKRLRLVNVGSMAGPRIQLDAGLGNYGVEIIGSAVATSPPRDRVIAGYHELTTRAARGELRVRHEALPLSDVEAAWARAGDGRRLVLVP